MVKITIMAVFCLLLAIGGVASDYIFPLNKWINSSSMEQVVDADYEVIEETEESKQITNPS